MLCAKRSFVHIALFVAFILTSCKIRQPSEPNPSTVIPPGNVRKIENTLHLSGLQTILTQPSQVQFYFSLRKLNRLPLTIAPEDIESNIRIFENNVELDYDETNLFIQQSERLELELVLVLDFTKSMAFWEEGGQSAISVISEEVKTLLNSLSPLHKVALVEYHDRSEPAKVLHELTTKKNDVIAALDQFLNTGVDHGSSRCWDAVHSAASLFTRATNSQGTRMMLLITDGFDTSSEHTPQQATAQAQQAGVEIHVIGAGTEINKDELAILSDGTNGVSYEAGNHAALREKIRFVGQDLEHQYRVNYLTLKTAGAHNVRVEIDWLSEVNSFEQTLDLGKIFGNDRVGKIVYDDATVQNGQVSILFRAEHVPRGIKQFRFRINDQNLARIDIVPRNKGGICEGWILQGPDEEEFYNLVSPDEKGLGFGETGKLFNAIFENLTESILAIPFDLDNSIYTTGKIFDAPDILFVGLPVDAPHPPNHSRNITNINTEFSWRVQNFRDLPLTYDILLDTLDASQKIATGLTSTNYTLLDSLNSNTTYHWRVIARSPSNCHTGPIWRFTTK